jgi:cyclopropane fatty-acyl-phospholipid synthase-like methyltransferase
MIRTGGWERYSVWEHSSALRELYARRARDEEPEMTCAAQAAELLAPLARAGETLLDVGCGAGHFSHSLRRRKIDVQYFGIDASRTFIEIGRHALAAFGVDNRQLAVMRIEDLDAEFDHIVCLNVLTNLDNFHRPLERMLRCARRSVILRESIADQASMTYVKDRFLDDDVEVNVHINTYSRSDVLDFIRRYGFEATEHVDRRAGGQAEMVIGYAHHWSVVVARRVH